MASVLYRIMSFYTALCGKNRIFAERALEMAIVVPYIINETRHRDVAGRRKRGVEIGRI